MSRLKTIVRLGLGGTVGSGRQGMSWIHEEDMNRLFERAIFDEAMRGTYVASSPNPVCQTEFMKALRRSMKMPIGLPAFRWMLPIGARLMGSETELVLKSRRVVPARLAAAGFEFEYPEWGSAAKDLCLRWRKGASN